MIEWTRGAWELSIEVEPNGVEGFACAVDTARRNSVVVGEEN